MAQSERFGMERETFRRFKAMVEAKEPLLKELEGALEVLLSQYNTTIYENRFVVGGACEHILGAVIRAAGIDAQNVGRRNQRIDIQVPGATGFSVKGSFTGKRDNIRLINSLGESETRAWSEATLFVLADKGIAYADPDLLPDATESKGDALILRRRQLDEFLDRHREWLIPCRIAVKSADIANSKVASEAVAREILARGQFPTLQPFSRGEET